MYSVSSIAEDILYGSDKPGIGVRKRAVRTDCAASYLSEKQVLLDMSRARICRMGVRSEDVHRSLATWRAGGAPALPRRRPRLRYQPEAGLPARRGDRAAQGCLRGR